MTKSGMRRCLISLLLLLSFFVPHVNAQGYYYYDERHYEGIILAELGIKGGLMNALTDIGGKTGDRRNGLHDLNGSFSRPCISLHGTLLFQNSFGLRIQYVSGQVMAADSILKKKRSVSTGRYERNLSFKSPVREFGLVIEIHPLSFISITGADPSASRISPYLLAGTGFFTFDPQARFNRQWYSLQPLHTEGQGFSMYPDRKPYALRQQNLLAGAGIRFEISAWLNGRIEITHRFLRTDYLDDVSQNSYVPPDFFERELTAGKARLARALADRRAEVDPGHITNPGYQRGNPADNDTYFTLEAGLSIVVGRRRR